jgi:hypothetical protein
MNWKVITSLIIAGSITIGVLVIKRHPTVSLELRDADSDKSIPEAFVGVTPALDLIASPGTCGSGPFLYASPWLPIPTRITGTAPGYQTVAIDRVLLPGDRYTIRVKKIDPSVSPCPASTKSVRTYGQMP